MTKAQKFWYEIQELLTRIFAPVSCIFAADFSGTKNLEQIFYSAPETWNHVPKTHLCHWSLFECMRVTQTIVTVLWSMVPLCG